jgi:hypothetical protein
MKSDFGRAVLHLAIFCAAILGVSLSARGAIFEIDETIAGHNYKAKAEISVVGGQLTLKLTNLGSVATVNEHVLTGFFWEGPGGLTPVSATPLSLQNDDGTPWSGDTLAQHVAYTSALSGYKNGVIMAGFDLDPATVFAIGGGNPILDGIDYGIVNGFGPNGIAGERNPFVVNSATFVLSGATEGQITRFRFQYGSELKEQSFSGGSVPSTLPIPEPASLAIWSLGVVVAGFGARRMRNRK